MKEEKGYERLKEGVREGIHRQYGLKNNESKKKNQICRKSWDERKKEQQQMNEK